MPLPATLNTVPVRGRYTAFDGTPVTGSVTFTPSVPLVIAAADDVVVIAKPIVATLDSTGHFSINLPATDDPDVNPTGFTYAVTESFGTLKGRAAYNIQVPLSAASAGLDISEISPVAPSVGVVRTTRLGELDDVTLEGITGGQGIAWNPAGIWEPRSFETAAGSQAKATAAHDAAVAEAAGDATTKADNARDSAVTTAVTAAAELATAAHDDAVAEAAADSASRVLVEHDRAVAAEQANTTAIAAEATTRATQDGLRLLKAGDTMSGPLAMGGNKVTGLADPTSAQDAATRAYVLAVRDALIGGAPGTYDTFIEAFTQFQADDAILSALVGTVATETTNRQNADTAEATARAAADNLRVLLTAVGAASGVAALDANARLPLTQKALRVIRAVTATTNFATGDDVIEAGGTTAYNVGLPSAVTFAGREFTLKRKSTGVITLTSAAGLIDDAATFPLNAINQSATVYSNGTDWQVI